MLAVNELTCARGDRELFRGLSFQAEPGDITYIRGKNGSGKTTLLRTICGYVVPEAGEITWNGTNVKELDDEYRALVLYLGHLNGLKDTLTAYENLRFAAKLAGQPVTDSAVVDALFGMGVEACQDLPVSVLSQGQKRRVALSRLLLIKNAELWILDEPFTALDVAAVEVLADVIAAHAAQGGLALLTTHQEVGFKQGTLREIRLGK